MLALAAHWSACLTLLAGTVALLSWSACAVVSFSCHLFGTGAGLLSVVWLLVHPLAFSFVYVGIVIFVALAGLAFWVLRAQLANYTRTQCDQLV